MARYRAYEAVCQSVADLLNDNYAPADFSPTLEFDVFSVGDFKNGLTAGVSVFLYRATVNGSLRMPPGRLAPNGDRAIPRLPIDLHLVLTVWAAQASTQHAIAGWTMRTLEDYPILPPGLLNRAVADTFDPDESVELAIDDLPTEDLLQLWELIGPDSYQLSIPYRARNIRLDSELSESAYDPVQDRLHRYGVLQDEATV